MPAQALEQMTGAGAPQGLAWSWELDFDALLAALAAAGVGEPGDPHDISGGAGDGGGDDSAGPGPGGSSGPGPGGSATGDSADGDSHADDGAGDDGAGDDGAGRLVAAGVLAGRVAEHLAPGPDLAGWLCQAPAAELSDYDLAASAGSWRRLASWAQARELAAVAQIVSRTAARDRDIGVGEDGRPARVPTSAAAEVALELTMSQYAAAGWADLATDLAWRLAATGAALAAGVIDLARARLIAEATAVLDEDAARTVEARVLPAAGGQTTGMLRTALRRAVIAADPEGAERRRKETERQAKVTLYPDQESTATLAGQRLPAIHAAAAMALIKAQARAMKAAGAPGPLDLLCAQVFLGRLLGTLPPIPPAEGAPPDHPPGDDGPGDPYDHTHGDPYDHTHGDPYDHSHGAPYDHSHGDPYDHSHVDGDPGDGRGGPGDSGPGGRPPGGPGRGGRPPRGEPARRSPGSGPSDGSPGEDAPGDDAQSDDVPPPGDADAPSAGEDCPCPDGAAASSDRPDDEDGWQRYGPAPLWPELPGIPPAFTRPADGRPPPGLLDLSVPWATLAGLSPAPGHLGRIGPVTATQARTLAGCAARDPAAEWRLIITDPAGHALAITRIPRARPPGRDGPPPPGSNGPEPWPCAGIGLVSRVTLTIPENLLAPGTPPTRRPPTAQPGHSGDPGPPGEVVARALETAAAASARARAAAAADAAAGGCAHTAASPGYRPPPRLRDHVTARDLTCRSPICRQPAWRRPGPHPPVRHRRNHLRLQPGRHLPDAPSRETPSRLETRADRPRHIRLDYPGRPHLRHHPRHPPALNTDLTGRQEMTKTEPLVRRDVGPGLMPGPG